MTHFDCDTRILRVKHGPEARATLENESLPELVANAALSLLNLCCYFLARQLAAQAATFEKEGGFTERLYRVRSQRRAKR